MQVEWHIDFVTRIGIPAVDPEFIVSRVYALGPDFVDQYIGLDFVVVAAINHQFVLSVEVTHRSVGLAAREIVD